MSNPSYLLFDSDVLIQFFVAGNLKPLQQLKKFYGIQPVVVVEVENELRINKKHKKHIQDNFDRAFTAGTLRVFDETVLRSFLSAESTLLDRIGSSAWSNIQATGSSYNLLVGTGEAFTHATAVALDLPVASNDMSALIVLERHDHELPSPVLRTFDLISFSYQAGLFSEQECDGIRKALLEAREGLPREFENRSFEDGINSFDCRLHDSSRPSVGVYPVPKHSYDKRLSIQPN